MATNTLFPDASTTGLPPGVVLTASGGLVITQPGVVISGLNITGQVSIEAPNVTIENCKISSSAWSVVSIADGVTGTVIQNCDINGVGSGNDGSTGINGQGTFLNNNIHNVENGISVAGSNTTITGNYIHDLNASGSPHYDGIQIDGGVSNVLISHNSVINNHGQTSAVMIDNDFGGISNIQVSDNLLVGGGYTVYSDGRATSAAITGVSFTNNHIGAGQFGTTSFDNNNPTYTGNVNDGAAIVATLNTTANDTASAGAGSTASTGTSASSGSNSAAPPAADVIAPDAPVLTGDTVVGNKVQVSGTAEAGSTVNLYDDSTLVGTTHAAANGDWNVTTSALGPGSHTFVATATDSAGNTSDPSEGVDPVIPSSSSGHTSSSGSDHTSSTPSHVTDTVAPSAPVLTGDTVFHHTVHVTGTAEAGSTISLYDGTTALGTTHTASDGHFDFTTPSLKAGAHTLVATATDAAGNTSGFSESLDPKIGASSSHVVPSSGANNSGGFSHSIGFHQLHQNAGASTAPSALQSQVASSDGANGSVPTSGTLADAHGHDQSGTSRGGDTFVFAPNFGSGLATNSVPVASDHITGNLGQCAFENFASVLAHAGQTAHDPGFAAGQDTLSLKDLKHSFSGHDFHFG